MLGNNADLFNKPFGLNIKLPTRTLQQYKETAEKAVSGIWEPVVDFFDSADNVFSGDVAAEIDKYNRMAYSLGATMRRGKERPSLNIKG